MLCALVTQTVGENVCMEKSRSVHKQTRLQLWRWLKHFCWSYEIRLLKYYH